MKKVLILTANPEGTRRLRLDKELREIKQRLQLSKKRDEFNVEYESAVRPNDIIQALVDHEPQIVHFSGHGEEDKGWVFEDETGQPKLVSGEALARLFKQFANQIECVVLNGCYSEVQAQPIAQHIQYVVGMTRNISDDAAIAFAMGFYDALGGGYAFDVAYKLGCSAIEIAGIKEYSTPVLVKKPEATGIGDQIIAVQPEPLSQSENQAIDVFFAYAPKDKELRDQLANHLRLLVRNKVIQTWSDSDITAGSESEQEIQKKLNSAQIILLLISADFIVSDFCESDGLERAMQRHKAKEARVIPIILRSVDWQDAPFGKLQPLPRNKQPVTEWPNPDQAFADISREISKVVKDLSSIV